MKISGKNILVTGGAGFIGSHLVDMLLKEDVAKVVVFDNYIRGGEYNISQALGDKRVELFAVKGDLTHVDEIEKAILNANLGFNPQNEGDIIRINVPPLTEERRLDLVKKAKAIVEDTKIGIRNARRQGNDEAKQLEKDGLPEDDSKKLMGEIQKLTDSYSEKIDSLFEAKEKDILTV